MIQAYLNKKHNNTQGEKGHVLFHKRLNSLRCLKQGTLGVFKST